MALAGFRKILVVCASNVLLVFPAAVDADGPLDLRPLGDAYLQYCAAAIKNLETALERDHVKITGTGESALTVFKLKCDTSDPLYKRVTDPDEIARIEEAVRSIGAAHYIQAGEDAVTRARRELGADEIVARSSQGEISVDDLKKLLAYTKIKAKIDALLSMVRQTLE